LKSLFRADDFEVGLEGFDTERGDLYVKAALAAERTDIDDSTI